jgi:flagella basal body P-ring formation protein FlgA
VGARSAVWVGSASMSTRRQGKLIWFSVAGYAPALVAVRTVAADAPLDAGDAMLADRDVVAADCTSPDSPDSLPGLRVKRTLHAGEILCANLLEPVPPVTRGEEVTLLYHGRSFTLTARGIAQADGLLGKPVMVRNSSSGDVFTATVSGRAEVSVND